MTDAQIIALVSAVLPFLIAFATYLGNVLIARLPKNRQTQLSTLAQNSVQAAEQLGKGQSGQVRKQIASDLIMQFASDFGVKLDQTLVSGLIEAAVFSMNATQPVKPAPIQFSQADMATQSG